MLRVRAAGGVSSPEWSSSPGSPANIDVVGSHVVDHVCEVSGALSAVCCTEFGDHGFETIGFEPGGDAGEVAGSGLGADGVTAGEVDVEVLMDIECYRILI